MAEQQKFYLERVAEFMEIELVKDELLLKPVDGVKDEDNMKKMSPDVVDVEQKFAENQTILYVIKSG